jgi:hypothetical protein
MMRKRSPNCAPGANPPCCEEIFREESDGGEAGAGRGSGSAMPVGICDSELTGAAHAGQNFASAGSAASQFAQRFMDAVKVRGF